jgi:hypothetical protein
MSQTEEPQIVHVWVCRIKGTTETVSVRATRDRAEQWVEDQVNDPEAEWLEGLGAKNLYRSPEATRAGMVAMSPVPDCLGMIVSEA